VVKWERGGGWRRGGLGFGGGASVWEK